MGKRLVGAMLLVSVVGAGQVTGDAAPAAWLEVRSPHFSVLSAASEKTARNVAWQFEQIRSALEKGWPWIGDHLDRPIIVIGAKDEASMKALVPKYWEKGSNLHPTSVFATGADRSFLVIRADVQGDGPEGVNPYQTAYWSYSALALESSANRGLPLWFTSGFREVASNTNVSNDLVQFGRALPDHVRRLQEHIPFPLEKLFSITRDSPEYTRQDARWDYDAECWGLMQFLLFGGVDVANRDGRVNRLAAGLLGGKSSSAMVTEVFGSVTNLDTAFRLFLSQGVFRYARLKVDENITAKTFTVRPVAAAEELSVRAALHTAVNRPEDARAALAEATKLDASLPAPHEVAAQLFDVEDHDAEARAAFEKAVQLGSTNFYAYYRLAFLMWTPTTERTGFETIEAHVARAIALNDTYAPAHDLLANARLRLGRPAQAAAPAKRAVELRPDVPGYRLSLAEVAGELGERATAVEIARAALSMARTDAERRRAQQVIDRYSRTP